MAELTIYRVAYVVGDDEQARVNFSRWVQAAGYDEILAELNIETDPPGIDPTFLGWQELKLDTDPF